MYFFGFGADENERETHHGWIAVQLSTSRQPDGMRSELEKQASVWIRKDTIQPRRLSANQQAAAVWNAVGWRRCLYGNVSGRLSERTGERCGIWRLFDSDKNAVANRNGWSKKRYCSNLCAKRR